MGSYTTYGASHESILSFVNGRPVWGADRGPYQVLVYSRSKSRTALSRRKKPVGVELVFNGTPHYVQSDVRDEPLMWFSFPGSHNNNRRGFRTIAELVDTPSKAPAGVIKAQPLSDNALINLLQDRQMDMLTNVAEGKQTISLFKSLVPVLTYRTERFVTDYVRLKRRYLSGRGNVVNDVTKRLADLHLSYVFGVKPLVGEVEGALKLWEHNYDKPLAKSKQKVAESWSQMQKGTVYYAGQSQNRINYYTHHEVKTAYKYRAYAELDDPTEFRWSRLGLDPLATAWELVPWSFAVDRFIQIGDFLQAISGVSGVKRTIVYEIYTEERKSTIGCQFGSGNYTSKYYSRSIRRPVLTFPVFVNTFTDSQVPTYVGLLRQNLGKWTRALTSKG